MPSRHLIVMHRAPDLDAITSAWLLVRFDAQHYGIPQYAFVEAGQTIDPRRAQELGFNESDITHVDTGLGRFDHHDEVRGRQYTSAAELVYFYLLDIHPELRQKKALEAIVDFTKQIDHFQNAFWPEADNDRYNFMLHELISGMDLTEQHDDQSQVVFGFQALDFAYAVITHSLQAKQIIAEEGEPFDLKTGRALALATRNDETIKIAQKQGFLLVVKKDPQTGHARIKARPDAPFDLKEIYEDIIATDSSGYWFYHPSGRMVLNGSYKNLSQPPTPLSLDQLVAIIKNRLS
ncbi:hypothetical protein FWH30_02120 [Microgenomates group bacterium]|nr:hypothetical protein [Microgenomates group bacterium]